MPYQDNPPRYDYRLTEKGNELAIVLIAMKAWGDRWTFERGERPPMSFRHDRCGAGERAGARRARRCGEVLLPSEATPVLDPGYEPGPGTSEIPAAVERLATSSA